MERFFLAVYRHQLPFDAHDSSRNDSNPIRYGVYFAKTSATAVLASIPHRRRIPLFSEVGDPGRNGGGRFEVALCIRDEQSPRGIAIAAL